MIINKLQKNILIAPLNWGLGHATRCIPIINELIKEGFRPIIASDGAALELLRKEFPDATHLELPSYKIEYSKKSKNFKWKIVKNSPKILKAISKEKKIVKDWISEYNLCGIISDNRLGVRSKKIPSVIITHQLTVFSGKTTFFSTQLHQYFINKFNECWIPDAKDFPNLSGKLGHKSYKSSNHKYIGVLSRFEKQDVPIVNDLLILLSGPEPQRTILEEVLMNQINNFSGKIVFVKGKIELEQVIEKSKSITFYNYMPSLQLQKTINESKVVLSRSGYTTLMDLAKLEKKAFFIPTPGQTEQEYLAQRCQKLGLAPYEKQSKFNLQQLEKLDLYKGFSTVKTEVDFKELFTVFQRK